MSTKLKKTLAATLAASIASGMAVVPAMADTTGVDVDALYATAYNATIKAQKSGKQEDINEARKAIKALEGTDAAFAIGEFSKIVDEPQQVILTKIVDGILEQTAAELPSQEKINEIKNMIVLLPNKDWENSYSSALDKAQVKLLDNAAEAYEKAIETGLKVDIDAANKLLDGLQTATNNETVVEWAKKLKVELKEKLGTLQVSNVEIVDASNVKISFNKVIDKSSVGVENIKITNVKDELTKALIKGFKVSEDRKNVTVTLVDAFKDGKYNVSINGVKDEEGKEITENKNVVEYKTKTIEVSSIAFKKTNIVWNDSKKNIRDFLIIKDSEGKDITKTADLIITSNKDVLVNSVTGEINGKGMAIVTVKVKNTKLTTKAVKLNIEKAEATTFKDAVFTNRELNENEKLLSKTPNNIKVDKIKVDAENPVYVYASFSDQEGNEMPLEAVKIENKTPTIADLKDSKVTGKQAGTLGLKFTNGKAQGYKEFKVVPKAVATKINLDEAVMNLAPTANQARIQRVVGATVLDQYGDKYVTPKGVLEGNFSIEYKVGETYIDASKMSTENKNQNEKLEIATLYIDPITGEYKVEAHKEGVVRARVVYKADGKVVTAALVVNVKGNKDVDRYEVNFVGGDNKIDLKNDKDEFILDIKGFNKDGANVGELSELNYEIMKGSQLAGAGIMTDKIKDVNQLKLDANYFEKHGVGVYKVIIKDGTHTVKTVQIEVVNTTPVATTVIAKANSVSVVNIKDTQEVEKAIQEVLVVKDQFGKDMDINTIEYGEIENDYFIENEKVNSYDLVIRNIMVNGKNISLAENIRINVRTK